MSKDTPQREQIEFKVGPNTNIDDWFLTADAADPAPDILKEHRITAEGSYPEAEPLVFIGNAAFAARGNLSVISGPGKGGKSAIQADIAAGALFGNDRDGISGIYVNPANGEAVVSFDTEQAQSDQQYQIRTILKRGRVEATPENLFAYNIRELSPKDKIAFTEKVCEAAAEKCGGIHLVVIDGGADYLKSVNDEEASSEVVLFFMRLSALYNCPVIVVVHVNPTTNGAEGKERGHFGSDLQRKCYGLITVTRKDDVSTLAPKMLRKAGLNDAPLIHFKYDYEKGYHVDTEDPKSEETKEKTVKVGLAFMADSIFGDSETLRHTEVLHGIMRQKGVKESAAKDCMKQMEAHHIIEKAGPGKQDPYRIILERSGKVGKGRPALPEKG